MQLVSREQYSLAEAVFAPLKSHLAVEALLAGATPGKLWLDDPVHPCAGLMQVHHRFYLSGSSDLPAINEHLRNLFAEEIIPCGRAGGNEAFSIYFSGGWGPIIDKEFFGEIEPIYGLRNYYEWTKGDRAAVAQLPDDLELVEVNEALLADRNLVNLDDLIEEMQSERSSVEEFLRSSFGYCLRSPDRIVTWCLSEYNLGNRCEVGIATDPAYRRRGLAAQTGTAFLKLAETNGISRVGWHCWESNEGSWRTALNIGFAKKFDYESYLIFYQPGVHQAVMGDIALNQGKFSTALTHLEQALAIGNAPGWAYLSAACAYAQTGESHKAFEYLHTAADRGILDRQRLMEIDYLKPLHEQAEWPGFLNALID